MDGGRTSMFVYPNTFCCSNELALACNMDGGRISALPSHNLLIEHGGGISLQLLHSVSMRVYIYAQHGWKNLH
eukprot:5199353-Karenia_brevis.AAC.1